MYENKFKNPKDTGASELDLFLELIADLNDEINLYAMGGTAMVLADIKEATKDIDFLTDIDYKRIKKLFQIAGLKEKSDSMLCNIWMLNEKTRIDLFYDGFIMGVSLPSDWKKLSTHIKTIGKLKLFILNWYDIIITKIARSEERDIEDILNIIKTQKIKMKKLKSRYYKIAETALISDYDYKFKHLEKKLRSKK